MNTLKVFNSSNGKEIEVWPKDIDLVSYYHDFPDVDSVDLNQAIEAVGNGWRAPTREELYLICEQLHKKGLGNFKANYYYYLEDSQIIYEDCPNINFQSMEWDSFGGMSSDGVRLVREI